MSSKLSTGNMKEIYKYLDQLTDKTKNFKVRTRIIQKGRPTQSPSKKRYQKLILEDEKGNKMRATLFEKDIESFDEALQRGGIYEISNAIIRQVPEEYQNKPNEFQMNFNDKVRITPIDTTAAQLEPQYYNIQSIPRTSSQDNLIDILGIVIFVGEPKCIQRGDNKESRLQEVLITDDSCVRPLLLSLWDDLASLEKNNLTSWAEGFLTFGFTAMRITVHRGFSLSSTMSTTIDLNPRTSKAAPLKIWAMENETVLIDCRSKAIEIKTEPKERRITTLAEIESKKAYTTWQDETFWVEVIVPTAKLSDIRPYIGCDKCGKKAEEQRQHYTCIFCKSTTSSAVPRVSFAFDAADDTGSYRFTLFTEDVEKLFQMKCADLLKLKDDDESAAAIEKVNELQAKTIYIKIGPTIGLSASHILKWNVKSVSFD